MRNNNFKKKIIFIFLFFLISIHSYGSEQFIFNVTEVEIKEKEVKPPRKPQTKQIKKNGELRKEISEEQQAKRLEILKAGREKALKMRQAKKAAMEAEKNKPPEPEPEPEKKYKVVKPKRRRRLL